LLRSGNPTVGRAGTSEIRWNGAILPAHRLPPGQHAQVEILFQILPTCLVDRQLLADAARTEGFAARPEIHEEVRRFEEDSIREAYVEDFLACNVSSAAAEARVKALPDGNGREDRKRR